MMKMNFPEDAQVGGQASEQLRKGEAVSVVGASERRGHLIVDHGGRQWNVPFQFMELVKSSTPGGDCVAAVVAGTTSLASVDIWVATDPGTEWVEDREAHADLCVLLFVGLPPSRK